MITWLCDLDLWPWTSWRLWLMRVVVLHPYTKFEVRIGLAVRKIWRTKCVSIITIQYNSGYLTCSKKLTGSQLSLPHGSLVYHTAWWPWSSTSWFWNWCASRIKGEKPSFKLGHARSLGSRIIRHVGPTRLTDGRAKAALVALFPTGAGAYETMHAYKLREDVLSVGVANLSTLKRQMNITDLVKVAVELKSAVIGRLFHTLTIRWTKKKEEVRFWNNLVC